MCDEASYVRAEAADAYGDLLKIHGTNLPRLLHETFLLLLHDPYRVVHSAALRAIRWKKLPAEYNVPLFRAAYSICQAYSDDDKAGDLTNDTLRELIYRAEAAGAKKEPMLEFIIKCLGKMKIEDCAELLPGLEYDGLVQHSGYPRLIGRILKSLDVYEYHADDIIRLLSETPLDVIKALKDDLIIGADVAFKTHHGLSSLFYVELLVLSGEPEAAETIVREYLASLPDTIERRRERAHTKLEETAIQLERACKARDFVAVARLGKEWRAVEKELAQDKRNAR